jgi:hypothetical protein
VLDDVLTPLQKGLGDRNTNPRTLYAAASAAFIERYEALEQIGVKAT